jgi:hypothetical protein
LTMDALVPKKASCGFRPGKKKRKKGSHIGYIDKKPRQRKKSKKAPSPPLEEESNHPVVSPPLEEESPVVPAVLEPAAENLQPCALFESPSALSEDPLSEESIAKMSPEEFATFLASLITVVHEREYIQATMIHLNKIFPPDTNQPTCVAATIPPSINPLAFHSNPATGSPVKPTYAAVKEFRSIEILNKAVPTFSKRKCPTS